MIPEKKELQAYAKQQGISGDYSDLLTNDQVTLLLLHNMLQGFACLTNTMCGSKAAILID